jgi:multidrug efflux pump
MGAPDDEKHEEQPQRGGLAKYLVDHREVGWMALVAMLLWGFISYGFLPQQEDPKLPARYARLVTYLPGATAIKVEELVTKVLEKKVAELQSVEELNSESRAGVSIITVAQYSTRQSIVDQEWDKLRAKLREVALPQGAGQPDLDTDFENTITLLFAVTSPPVTDAECRARAHLIRSKLRAVRGETDVSKRAAVVAFFPAAISQTFREDLAQQFAQFIEKKRLGSDMHGVVGSSFLLADFASDQSRDAIRQWVADFKRSVGGTDAELHPDFGPPLILIGDEDPLPQIRATAMPRYSYRALEVAADELEDDLRQVASVGKTHKIGTVNEMVHLLFSLTTVNGYDLSTLRVIEMLQSRNQLIPGGTLRAEGQNFPVQLSGEFRNEKELLGAVVGVTKTGMPIYLRDLFDLRRDYENPVPFNVNVLKRPDDSGELTRHRAVLLGVEMKEGNIIGDFAKRVHAVVDKFKSRLPEGMEVTTVSDQPTSVQHRINHFDKCFLEAVMIVILVALLLMDWRSALIVATGIPLTVAMTIGGMHLIGLPLHQISIASLIIALGMLVDDPVVAADAINRQLAHGQPRRIAAWLGPFKLRRAILFATVINIVAFLPLLLLPGDKSAFIFALPVVVTLALVASRIVSMSFIPLLGYYFLRGQKGLEEGGEVRRFFPFSLIDRAIIAVLPKYRAALERALQRPWLAVGIAYGLLVASFGLTHFIGKQFFPPAERNQLVIDIGLPKSTSLAQTRATCDEVVRILKTHDEITSAAVFSGGTAPRFYYNVSPKPPGSHLAQIFINTKREEDVPPLVVKLRDELDSQISGARCLVRQLEVGPPVDAPIQIELSGDDLDVLRSLADNTASVLRDVGAYKVQDDLGRRVPTLEIAIDQERANTLGVENSQVGTLMRAAFSDIKVTELREGDHLVPVVIQMKVQERNEAEKIRSLYVESATRQLVPLSSFATVRVKPEFATIPHHNQLRTVTVEAYSVFGELPSKVLARAKPALGKIELPPGYRLEYAGEERELKKSQNEMTGVMLISLSLIFLAMVIQFNSVVKSVVVMLTIPLGLIGALSGLAIMRAPFGFMALLAIVSLAGVVVSHIIVLSDFIEHARSGGMPLRDALIQAGLVRMRPVLVTVLATIGGLLPLALTGGLLWRPLTAVHIFGLLIATTLTLFILPVLYFLFSAKLKWIK